MNRFKPDTAKRITKAKYIVSQEGDIRPYGILIKELRNVDCKKSYKLSYKNWEISFINILFIMDSIISPQNISKLKGFWGCEYSIDYLRLNIIGVIILELSERIS